MCSLDQFRLNTKPDLPVNLDESNPPPRTVPYPNYQYPNYGEKKKLGFNQPNSGFGFSNFRLNLGDSATPLNKMYLPKYQHYDNSQVNNPEATMPFSRSEQFLFREKYGDYYMMEQTDAPEDYVHSEVIDKTINSNPLSQLFFSERNVNHVLKLTCRMIRLFCEQYRISPEFQNKNELLTVFRSMYLQVPTNPYGDLEQELCRLNRAVLDWVVPRMIVNIQQYLGYMRDQSTRLFTIPRPQNTNIEGTKANKFFSSMML
jgi:hypothetical protein